ncbi:related to carbonic anhydrase precursor [Rhynchosporium secalis]|uniref:Related to carbonic anhydrase n=1 Tax=Rhynchosporium secalis TaxID=38038 RepID=A0A1E1MVG4_RHYSE|nr:related to carbonic anhydrase precursor [Rhynchosporium secalis]
MLYTLITLTALTLVLACPQHDFNTRTVGLGKRADGLAKWTYATSGTWGASDSASRNDTICHDGMTQSPINLPADSFSTRHAPKFKYSAPISGALYNWGFGPSFSLNKTNGVDYSANPSFTYDNQTVYMLSWHTHAPSEHLVGGRRTRAELHLVHGDAKGNPKGVVGLRINPSTISSPFIEQFVSKIPGHDSSDRRKLVGLDMSLAIKEVGGLEKFWTYKGSLTTPPCSEGLRWWVSGDFLQVSDVQMRTLLGVSVYSARVEQMVWNHAIGV